MRVSFVFLLILIYHLLNASVTAPTKDDDDVDDIDDAEKSRHHRRRRKRPCRRDASGKTFFDWSYSYINVNHNYNIICGSPSSQLGGGYNPLTLASKPAGNHYGGQTQNVIATNQYSVNENDYQDQDMVKTKAGGSFDLFDWLLGIEKHPKNSHASQNVHAKPVQENFDQVPTGYQHLKPGQYVTAYNPLFGNYMQDVSHFSLDKLLKPLYQLFKR